MSPETNQPGPPLDCDSAGTRRWVVLLWLFTLGFMVALAVPVLEQAVSAVDERIYDLAVAVEQPLLVEVARAFDTVGIWTSWSLFTFGVAAILLVLRHWAGLAVWLVSMTIAWVASPYIKLAYERERPPDGLVEAGSYAFVSGHATTAAALAFTLVLILVPAGPRRRRWLWVALAYAVLMAWSRIYLRVHWLSDTLGGLALGAAIAVTVALFSSWWYAKLPLHRVPEA